MNEFQRVQKYLVDEGMIDIEPSGRKTVDGSHYTPDYLIRAVKDVMGGIDVDPASCKLAQKRIQAKIYYDVKNNGLIHPWIGRVYLCPSYGHQAVFVEKANFEHKNGNMTAGIIHAPTHETWEGWFHMLLEMSDAHCFFNFRIKWRPAWQGYEKELLLLGIDHHRFSPYSIHGNLCAYIGPESERFGEVFSEFGAVYLK